jgi:hypothetical protein
MAHRFVQQVHTGKSQQDSEELEAIKLLLVSVLLKNSPLDRNEIISYIFGDGKKIIWS